jgi:hypothetical protein
MKADPSDLESVAQRMILLRDWSVIADNPEIGPFAMAVAKRRYRVRLNSANHQWGKDPPKEVVG